MTQLNFVDFIDRRGISTSMLQKRLSDGLVGNYPGVNIFIEVEAHGPPTGNPVNIEIKGKNLDVLLGWADTIIRKIENSSIEGIERLKNDIEFLSEPYQIGVILTSNTKPPFTIHEVRD